MISTDGLVCFFDPASSIKTRDDEPRPSQGEHAAEPGTSFARGVAVGLAVAVPVWACVILSTIR
jgi:hypothetical protein